MSDIASLRARMTQAGTMHAHYAREYAVLCDTVALLHTEVGLLKQVDEVLLEVSSKVLGDSVDKIDALLTVGLRMVFEGQDLSFRTEVVRLRGRTSVKFHLAHGEVEAPLMDAYGGGVLAIAGVLLRVVSIMALGLRRTLLLDETLSMVADQFIPATSQLLKKLVTDLGFEIVLVTHNPRLAEHADHHYTASPSATIRGAVEFSKASA